MSKLTFGQVLILAGLVLWWFFQPVVFIAAVNLLFGAGVTYTPLHWLAALWLLNMRHNVRHEQH